MAKHRETAKHLEAFETWYAAGRSTSETLQKVSVSERTLYLWQEWFDWHARADKRDAEARAIADREAIKRKAAMLTRHRQAAELMQRRGIECLSKKAVDDARVAKDLIKDGIAIERQNEGMPDWVVELLNADEQQLQRKYDELDRRRAAAMASISDSPGDAAAVESCGGA